MEMMSIRQSYEMGDTTFIFCVQEVENNSKVKCSMVPTLQYSMVSTEIDHCINFTNSAWYLRTTKKIIGL